MSNRLLTTSLLVIALGAALAASGASAPQAEAMKHWRDSTFGIEFDLPQSWTYRLTPAKDYLFEGPKGTDAFEVSIILQFVTKAGNPGSSATAQAARLERQLASLPDAATQAREQIEVDGCPAAMLRVTYIAGDSTGAPRTFSHTQLVVDHGDYYYLISFSAPSAIYQKYLDTFRQMATTIRLAR